MRLRSVILAYVMLVAAAGVAAAQQSARNTDRPGSDYNNFEIGGTPDQCRMPCLKDARCQAWTFVKPGIQGRRAHCWLKDRVPQAVSNPCCVSGTRAVRID
ncbi:MAG TPA: PAN domain-containing protein [Steroidobacteraceae bacterium]